MKFPQSPANRKRTIAVGHADAKGLAGNRRDAVIGNFVQGYDDGAAQERDRWRRLSEHPRFRSHYSFAVDLYSRTGDLEGTLAALDIDGSAETPS